MKLETYLQSKDLKPTTFAAKVGVYPSTITRILRGERSPSLELVMKIERATKGKVKPRDWFSDEGVAA
ncbi:helix-turn-helix transcriptional regulator [Nitratireductor indicus]|uniref:helix-turn-helix transcriptional regulator n=1 Tax=Nitratireductor indicus TaxID=721133 RepID=UPI0028743C18|nr:helix-turn-helix transcriptional regulator [Nitratireductor indicus]MDS1138603.1 helix-turn-helix transcriptional regulator [Nitratireductor indicus]